MNNFLFFVNVKKKNSPLEIHIERDTIKMADVYGMTDTIKIIINYNKRGYSFSSFLFFLVFYRI